MMPRGPNVFGHSLSFPLEPPANQSFQLSYEICQHLQDGLARILFYTHWWLAEDESYMYIVDHLTFSVVPL